MEHVFDWARWRRYFRDASLAQQWFEYVPDPLVAAAWYFWGVRDPAEAAEWIRLRIPPQTIEVWRSAGFPDSSQALRWVRIGQSVDQVKRWIEIGCSDPDRVVGWIRIGQSVDQVKGWIDVGCNDPESAGVWESLGQRPESLSEWFKLGVKSPEKFASLRADGLTIRLARGLDVNRPPAEGWKSWTQLTTQGQAANPEIVNNWLVADVPLSEAAEWVDVGATPLERDILVSNGISLEVLKGLKTSTCSELVRNLQSEHQDLAQWFEQGIEFDEMMQWKQLRIPVDEVIDWQALAVPRDKARQLASMGFTPMEYLDNLEHPLIQESNLERWAESGLPRGSVKMFILGGVPNPETAQKWLAGFGYDPSRAVAQYQAFGGDYRRARTAWRKTERTRAVPQPGLPPVHVPPELPPESLAKRLPLVSDEWLEEIIAWARTLQPHLRKSIPSPLSVHLPILGIEIQIEFNNDLIRGRVTAGSQTFTCAFDPESFDPIAGPASSEQRFIMGVCLCWFIDCSIVLRHGSQATSALFRVATADPGRTSPKIRYVPTPAFSTRRTQRRSEDKRGLKIRHEVSGHVRALPIGKQGSGEARRAAPKHIQKVMKSNETYVRPHFRGADEQRRELETRLSRYSALGEAMSDLDWES